MHDDSSLTRSLLVQNHENHSVLFLQPNGPTNLTCEENWAGNLPTATTFTWDIYLFGGDSTDASAANVNLSALTDQNDCLSLDGLWFAHPQKAVRGGASAAVDPDR